MKKDNCRLCQQWSKVVNKQLDKLDNDNLAAILVDPKYKSLLKLFDNLIIDLQNKMFREATEFEEFLAIKWTRTALQFIPRTIKQKYEFITKKHAKVSEVVENPERFEGIPDGIIDSTGSTSNT